MYKKRKKKTHPDFPLFPNKNKKKQKPPPPPPPQKKNKTKQTNKNRTTCMVFGQQLKQCAARTVTQLDTAYCDTGHHLRGPVTLTPIAERFDSGAVTTCFYATRDRPRSPVCEANALPPSHPGGLM